MHVRRTAERKQRVKFPRDARHRIPGRLDSGQRRHFGEWERYHHRPRTISRFALLIRLGGRAPAFNYRKLRTPGFKKYLTKIELQDAAGTRPLSHVCITHRGSIAMTLGSQQPPGKAPEQ